MTLSGPELGLVIRYSYLWHSEHLEGREEGQKDRPCAVVATVRKHDARGLRVLVLPITHREPADPSAAMEIPPIVKQRLGLDDERSWVVLSEWNDFVWPGPDLRPVPGSNPATIAHGFLPPRFFTTVRDRFLALAQRGKARQVARTE